MPAGGQTVERGAVGRANEVPVVVDALYLVGVAHEVFVGVFDCGEVDGKVAAVGRHVENVLPDDGSHLVGVMVMHTRKDDVGPVRALFQVARAEAHEAPPGRDGDDVGLRVVDRLGFRQFHAGAYVARPILQQFASGKVVAVDAALTHYPQVAIVVFDHRLHHALVGLGVGQVAELEAVGEQVRRGHELQAAPHGHNDDTPGTGDVGLEHVGCEQRGSVAHHLRRGMEAYG